MILSTILGWKVWGLSVGLKSPWLWIPWSEKSGFEKSWIEKSRFEKSQVEMSYNHFKVISYLLNKPDIYAVVATHNEKAVADIVEMLKRKTEFNTIVFGQIYGMGEQITMPLGE